MWAAAVAVSELPDDSAARISASVDEIAWTPEEVGRAARFRQAEDRRSYLAAHRLVRTVAARAMSVPVSELVYRQKCDECSGIDHGRPWLQQARRRIPVSVSHSRSAVACAVGDQSTVDVDDIDGFDQELVGVLSADEEARASGSAHPPELRARLWTLKECLVKQGWVTLDRLERINVMDAVEQGIFEGSTPPMNVLRLPVVGGNGAQVATLLVPAGARVTIENLA